jgi:hypothetical protein
MSDKYIGPDEGHFYMVWLCGILLGFLLGTLFWEGVMK